MKIVYKEISKTLEIKEAKSLHKNWLWFYTLTDYKEIQPVNPKGNQSWIFTGRTDAEAETPVLWPSDKNRLIGKDPDARKD